MDAGLGTQPGKPSALWVSWYAAAITAPRPHHLIALGEVGDTGKPCASSPKWRRHQCCSSAINSRARSTIWILSGLDKRSLLTELALSLPMGQDQGSGPSPPFASAPSIARVAPRHALDRQLVEAMNGLGFGTSPSKAATVQTVPF